MLHYKLLIGICDHSSLADSKNAIFYLQNSIFLTLNTHRPRHPIKHSFKQPLVRFTSEIMCLASEGLKYICFPVKSFGKSTFASSDGPLCFRWRRRSTPCARFCPPRRDTPQSSRGSWASPLWMSYGTISPRAGRTYRPQTRMYAGCDWLKKTFVKGLHLYFCPVLPFAYVLVFLPL